MTDRLTRDQIRDHLRRATLREYDHGGGRLFLQDGERRKLIADFYGADGAGEYPAGANENDPGYRDYIMSIINRDLLFDGIPAADPMAVEATKQAERKRLADALRSRAASGRTAAVRATACLADTFDDIASDIEEGQI